LMPIVAHLTRIGSTMASYASQKAGQNVFGDIQREWTSNPDTASENPAIDWNKFNYPPYLRLVHFDMSELPSSIAGTVRLMHIWFLMLVAVSILNFIDVIVLSIILSAQASPVMYFVNIAYSFLNFVIFVPLGGYTAYSGYVALATSSSFGMTKYLILQSIMGVLTLFFVLAPVSAWNGFLTFGLRAAYHGQVYWIIAIVLESTTWLAILVLEGLCGWKAYKYNPYHSQSNR